MAKPHLTLNQWIHIAFSRTEATAEVTGQDLGKARATQGQDGLQFAVLENNALLFAPRIVFRFC